MTKSTLETRFAVEDKLSIKKALIFIAFIGSVVMILVGVAILQNIARQRSVISRYSQETRQLIGQYPAGFGELFTTTMDICSQELAVKKSLSTYPQSQNDVDCVAAKYKLSELKVDSWRDSSAVAYLRKAGNGYELLEASGKFTQQPAIRGSGYQFSYRNIDQLSRFLVDGEDISMWDDYISFIPGKEVIVPVRVEDKTIGYIFRGVIER